MENEIYICIKGNTTLTFGNEYIIKGSFIHNNIETIQIEPVREDEIEVWYEWGIAIYQLREDIFNDYFIEKNLLRKKKLKKLENG